MFVHKCLFDAALLLSVNIGFVANKIMAMILDVQLKEGPSDQLVAHQSGLTCEYTVRYGLYRSVIVPGFHAATKLYLIGS